MHVQSLVTRRTAIRFIAAVAGTAIYVRDLALAAPAASGKFVGKLTFRPLKTDSGVYQFQLLENYGYMDVGGRMWQAKAGLPTDGASIPSVFWPFIGHPYQGLYLDAAVIHDFYCTKENRYRKWQDVHHVFHEAMLANGVGTLEAKLMFFAVWRFGPRWDISELIPCTPDPAKGQFCASVAPSGYNVTNMDVISFEQTAEKAILDDAKKWIEKDNPDPDRLAQYEASLPPLARGDDTTKFQGAAKMWYFENPYQIPLVEPKD
ncbi:DUF1353 domain-containing protein [Rhizobium ruizarguesonis]|uniref:DUF1353 domain-containing protein n=1 Tax=Rhizobium ruizarguesonis TaxID=2081791 RepID=UPI00103082CA|nr:DUF1353 domain-containing protein [Rhizobium ruizarguesonis]TBC68719.1 DUF1353 domain-containing protein [Rhizobium ruizarguesonis]